MFIEIKNAKKQYGSGEAAVYALDGVDLSLEKGKIYVILGPSGSGKSTLLNMIGGLDSLDSGELIIDGRNISSADKKSLTRYRQEDIGFVFQFYNLIPDLSVEENIEVVADISKAPLDMEEVLKALDIEKYRRRFPKELSGGQQQRVAIARALANEPHYMLCDEATSALDSRTTVQVLDLLAHINAELGVTMVVITHSLAVARRICNRIAVIDAGHIVEEGFTADVFANPKSEITRELLDWGDEAVDQSRSKQGVNGEEEVVRG